MKRNGEEWILFSDLRYSDNADALREIARLVREGFNERLFLDLLADHIDPDKRTPFGTKFALKHRNRGALRKRSSVNLDLGHFLWRHIDVWGEPAESVVADARNRFNVSRSKAFEVLEEYRAMFRRDLDHWQRCVKVEIALREAGDPDAAPFSPGKS